NALLIPRSVEVAVQSIAQRFSMDAIGILSYLANEIRVSGRVVPYSTVAAVDADSRLLERFCRDGGMNTPLEPGEILLNDWAAGSLGAKIGDRIELDYYVTADSGWLATRTAAFTLRGIVPLQGAAADPGFVPQMKGITDTRHMS